jgi:integrase/recombinase XerD
MNTSQLGLQEHVAFYLSHWRALGRRYRQEEWLLKVLQRELPALGHHDLTAEAFSAWQDARKDRHPNSRRKWAQQVRHFCLFRRRSDPDCFVPGPELACRRQPYVTPVIVGDPQVARMLSVADTLEPCLRSPLRAESMRLATVLLYTTGMRIGELVRLTLQDIEEGGAVLRIRDSKFHKSRLLPLSGSTQVELGRFLERRAASGFDLRGTAALLCTRRRTCKPYAPTTKHQNTPMTSTRSGSTAYSLIGMQKGITALFVAAGVTNGQDRRPRVHDLRHSFAVGALARWYRQGADVQVQLPKLAIYMGHISIESTAHYLRLTDEVAALASDRFEAHFAGVIGAGS